MKIPLEELKIIVKQTLGKEPLDNFINKRKLQILDLRYNLDIKPGLQFLSNDAIIFCEYCNQLIQKYESFFNSSTNASHVCCLMENPCLHKHLFPQTNKSEEKVPGDSTIA